MGGTVIGAVVGVITAVTIVLVLVIVLVLALLWRTKSKGVMYKPCVNASSKKGLSHVLYF